MYFKGTKQECQTIIDRLNSELTEDERAKTITQKPAAFDEQAD